MGISLFLAFHDVSYVDEGFHRFVSFHNKIYSMAILYTLYFILTNKIYNMIMLYILLRYIILEHDYVVYFIKVNHIRKKGIITIPFYVSAL